MAFLPDQLLLPPDKQAQLEAALANTGQPDPLGLCCAEAEADVARLTAGYLIERACLDGFIRALALWKAYTLAETAVPDAIQKSYDAAMAELRAIAAGQRPNLPATTAAPPPSAAWGSRPPLAFPPAPGAADETGA